MNTINKLLSLTIFIFLLATTSFTLAEEIAVELKPGHPQQYTVKKGDTLWDISGTFLQKPWYWPEIWHINPQVKNPHLIYPGDVLKLIYIDGKPYITRSQSGKRTIRLSPETRTEQLDRAIPTIPLDIISPYLTKNRILNAREYSQLPYIVGINEEHMSAGANNLIYVMGIPENSNDEIYGIYRRGKAYKNPKNKNEVLGYEAIYLGEGSMERKGNPATIYVEKSKAEILKKHRIIPINRDKVIDANFLPKASDVKRSGEIIGVLTSGMQPGVKMVGALDVVIVDIGLKDGVQTGDVFNIYKKGVTVKDPLLMNKSVKLPNEINGNLMIFRSFNRLSYAIVMSTQSTLRVGDVIKSPYLSE